MRRRVPVLCYHSVCTDPPPLMRDWAISPARFREHLAYFAGEGMTTLTVTEYVRLLVAGAPLPERLVLITFDDGFADFATDAAPALAEAGMAATLYVSTAYVGETSHWLGPDGSQPMLGWDQITEVAAAGIEIGAHAHRHLPLDELDRTQAQLEIVEAKKRIEDQLGALVESFAYPHGYHTRAIKNMVALAGFSSAAAVKNALSGPGDDVYAIARILVPGDAPVEEVAHLMRKSSPAPRHERLQTKAWRTVRRARARRTRAVARRAERNVQHQPAGRN
jgi:peptidoglycan/xylan/chitin deacetylase (PgdA/CDA1 family)